MMRWVVFIYMLVMPLISFSQDFDKKIAILETVDRDGNVTQGIKLMLRGQLTMAVTNTPGYVGLDRVDMDAVLAEHNFQRTGMVAEKDIRQLGVALGAEYVMVAEVAWFNAYKTEMVITAKLIDVESLSIVKTAMLNSGVTSYAIGENCRVLAKRLLKSENTFKQTPGSGIIPKY